MTPKKRMMMTGRPNAISPVIGATEAVFDEDYWEQKAKQYRSERDAALALAERRAGKIAAMKGRLRTLTSGFWYVDSHNPYLSAGHYLRLTADERVMMESLAATPPAATEGDGGGTR